VEPRFSENDIEISIIDGEVSYIKFSNELDGIDGDKLYTSNPCSNKTDSKILHDNPCISPSGVQINTLSPFFRCLLPLVPPHLLNGWFPLLCYYIRVQYLYPIYLTPRGFQFHTSRALI